MGLQDAFECLAISPDGGGQPGPLPVLADSPRKGATPELGAKQPLPHELVSIGPPAHCTRPMQKELDLTLLRSYEEAKALEKKRKTNLKKKKKLCPCHAFPPYLLLYLSFLHPNTCLSQCCL
jgi:hypothetical protein